MLQPRAGLGRFASAALLAFQIAVSSAWQALESGRVDATPHVERAGGTDCPVPHDEALCRICQATSQRLMPSRPDVPAFTLGTGFHLTRAAAQRPRVVAVPRVGAPRAPPPSLG